MIPHSSFRRTGPIPSCPRHAGYSTASCMSSTSECPNEENSWRDTSQIARLEASFELKRIYRKVPQSRNVRVICCHVGVAHSNVRVKAVFHEVAEVPVVAYFYRREPQRADPDRDNQCNINALHPSVHYFREGSSCI